MSVLAASTVAALLIASPSVNDADRVAANGGFLLGSAQRCGIAGDRLVRAGHVVRRLISGSALDAREEEDATARFARFFLVSAMADAAAGGTGTAAAPCRKVVGELDRLEQHLLIGADAADGEPFRFGDGK